MQSVAVTTSFFASIGSMLRERFARQPPQPPAAIDFTPKVSLLQSRLAHGMARRDLLAAAGSAGRIEPRSDALETLHWHDPCGHTIAVTLRKGLVVRWEVAHEEAA